ncbi:hypothetical protein FPOA_11580 [Fusarium poae]|uniref:Uncharacterized protein n=1 Tax=Fusarium poae TaxID=36050 RepID=A0A1B8AH79_FUSPO|nr:hypothetical protein FPOA_11580 [Fusarium poae]
MRSIEGDSPPIVKRKTRLRSTASAISRTRPSSSKSRATQSVKGSVPDHRFSPQLSPPPSRKRPSDVADQEQLPKRQRSASHGSVGEVDLAQPGQQNQKADEDEEAIHQPGQQHQGADKDEEAMPQPDQQNENAGEDEDEEAIPPMSFFDGINKNIGASVAPEEQPSLLSNSVDNPTENDDGALSHVDTSREIRFEKPAVFDTADQHRSSTARALTEAGDILLGIALPEESPQPAQSVSQPGSLQQHEPSQQLGSSQRSESSPDLPELGAILDRYKTGHAEAPQPAQPVSRPESLPRPDSSQQPEPSQRGPQQSGHRKSGQQRKKATYYEFNQGSEFLPEQSTQPISSRNPQAYESIYDVPDSPPRQSNQTKLVERSQKALVSTGRGSPKMKQKQKRNQASRRRSSSTQHQDDEGQQEISQDYGDEHGDNDSASSGDEPEMNQEQEQDVPQQVEDSLMLDAPPADSQAADSIHTIRIKRMYVQKLIHIMTLPGWIEKRSWKNEFLDHAADKSDELASQPDCPVLSARILAQLFNLYELYKDIPKAPKIDQLAYQNEKATKFSDLISNLRHSIDSFIGSINNFMKSATPEEVQVGSRSVTRLRKRIIPMLVLLLDVIFEAGCGQSASDGKKASKQTGEFTVYLLEPLERAVGWAGRALQAVEGWYELHPPRRELDTAEEAKANRAVFGSDLATLKQELRRARKDLEKPRPSTAALMQRDEAVRKEREAREQERRKRQNLQMQRFRESIQRIDPYRRPARASPIRQAVSALYRPSQPRSAPSTMVLNRSRNSSGASLSLPSATAPSQPLSDREYYERHGWYYWEDDQILTLIRTTAHPNYENFQWMLPDRSPDELRERSRYLKLVVREKYQRNGIPPPGFCMDED